MQQQGNIISRGVYRASDIQNEERIKTFFAIFMPENFTLTKFFEILHIFIGRSFCLIYLKSVNNHTLCHPYS